LLALFFAVSLYLRVYLPYDSVFSGEWIKFTSVDAYSHMRLVDSLVYNFPHLIAFDPYFLYPGGTDVGNIHFFDWLLASIIWVIGLGSPTQHTIDVVAAYFPAVLGALTVIPVFLIGKELFGRWAGIISAGLIAILPGEFLGRSILGFADHHVAEVLFTTVTMLFLILAIKSARQRQLTFRHLKCLDWATGTKPVIYSLLTGISLGLYLLTWIGGLLFAFIISVYFITQFIIDHLKQQSSDYLGIIGAILFLVATIMFLSVSFTMLFLVAMVAALLTPLVLSYVSRFMAHRGIKPAYYPLVVIGPALAGIAILYIINNTINSPLLSSIFDAFRIFMPRGASLTTMEMQPLLFPRGNFSLDIALGNFTSGFFIGLISLAILFYLTVKRGSPEKSLILVWSLVILAATLGQRRFAYYFAVNVALLTGYLSWQFLHLAGFRENEDKAEETPHLVSRVTTEPEKKKRKVSFQPTTRHINMALAVIIVFFIAIFPNIMPALATSSQTRFAPSDAWMTSLIWLKENTPEPFGDPDFYYQYYEPAQKYPGTKPLLTMSDRIEWIRSEKKRYPYPDSAYGIMAWWDYGYWITRIGHRLPNANPSQSAVPINLTANFFLSQNEEAAQKIIEALESSYIIIDDQITSGKFWAIAVWAGIEGVEFFEDYLLPQEENKLVMVRLFYPEYYRAMTVRLYNFDGQAVTPQASPVVSFEEKVTKEGKPIVPLESLKHYKLVHSSDESVAWQNVGEVPSVKIFEYLD